jgi:hypothetical protein
LILPVLDGVTERGRGCVLDRNPEVAASGPARIPHLAAGFKSSRLIDQAYQRWVISVDAGAILHAQPAPLTNN